MSYKTIVYCPDKCNNNQSDLTVLSEIFLAKFGKNTDFPCQKKRLICFGQTSVSGSVGKMSFPTAPKS